MNAKNLIDDGYYEEVLLLTPDQVNDFARKQEKLNQVGSGKGDVKFMNYGEEQPEYKGQDNYPSVEEAPLLEKLKQFEGLGSDHVISQYYCYKQYERLLKDYFEKQIPLPNNFTVEYLIREQRQIMKDYGKAFITLGIGHIPIDAGRITNQEKDKRQLPRLPGVNNGGDGGGGDGGGGDGGPGGNNLLRSIDYYNRRRPSLSPHRPLSPYKSQTPSSSRIPISSFQRSPYELRQRKQKAAGKRKRNEKEDEDEIEEGQILYIIYPIPVFDRKWKKVTSS